MSSDLEPQPLEKPHRRHPDNRPGADLGQPYLGADIVAFVPALNRIHLPSSPHLIASPRLYPMCLAAATPAVGLIEYLISVPA